MTRALVWLRAEQTDLALAIASGAGLDIALAGSPDPTRAPAVARALSAAPADDLRRALVEADAELALLLDPGAFGEEPGDARALLAAAERGVRVAATRPIPASALSLGPAWRVRAATTPADEFAALVPLLRAGAPWRSALDLADAIGEAGAIVVECAAARDTVGLGGLLADAIDAALATIGDIDTIHAVLDRPHRADSLADITGRLHATARSTDGRPVSIILSDHAPAWSRRATIHTDRGVLRVSDSALHWTDHEGHDDRSAAAPAANTAADIIAGALRRVLDPSAAEPRPIARARVLAVAQAALLSARTHQPERPMPLRG